MKSLQYILSKNSKFHSLNDTIKESLRIGICDEVKVSACESLRIGIDDDPYQYHPTKWNELRQIINDRYEELGPGTEQEPIDFNDIDVSGMTTFYNENKLEGIFAHTEFEYIDISDWDVSNVEDMCCMFKECYWLNSTGDISNWDVSNVKRMGNMFRYCENLEFVGDLSNWDVSRVKNMNGMFSGCGQLKLIGDISNWNISSVKDMRYMFDGSDIINIPSWYEE